MSVNVASYLVATDLGSQLYTVNVMLFISIFQIVFTQSMM